LVYVGSALDIRACKRWCARFNFGDFNLSGKDRPGSSIEANDSLLEEVEQDP
jgi:hypothetical protein